MSGYVLNIGQFMFVINAKDIFFSALISFFLTCAIMCFLTFRRLMKVLPTVNERFFEAREIIERCHRLFPIEVIEYKGITFRRGMMVNITLSNNKTFTGSFVGVNTHNMVCVITPKNIIAQELKTIENLVPSEQAHI